MIFSIFAYKDTELNKFQPAFLAPSTIQDAVEGITDAAIKGKVDDCAHKELFFMGTFDTEKGTFDIKEAEKILDLKVFAKRENA